jgi:hypothetical protein
MEESNEDAPMEPYSSPTLRFDEYASYSTPNLRRLVESGNDDKALLALAERFHRERNYEEARSLYHEAVIRGYTALLLALNRLPPRELSTDRERPMADLWVEANSEFLARLIVYRRREGPLAEFHFALSEGIGTGWAGRTYGSEAVEALHEAAEERADELYEELEAERAARGLPPFDNGRPPIAQVFEADVALIAEAIRSGIPECGEE